MNHECPRCGSKDITVSHRRGIEKLFKYVVPRVPYRCKECWTRFWKFENPVGGPWLKILAPVLGVLIVVVIIVLIFTRDEKEKVARFDMQPEMERRIEEKPKRLIGSGEKQPIIVEKPNEETGETASAPEDKGASPDTEPKRRDIKPIEPLDDALSDKTAADPERPPEPDDGSGTVVKRKAQGTKKKSPGEESGEATITPFKTVTNIWNKEGETDFRMMIASEQQVTDYKYFFMKSPPRLVINLAGKWDNPGNPDIPISGKFVEKIRIGEHDDHLSVVLDLNDPGPYTLDVKESGKGLELIMTKNG